MTEFHSPVSHEIDIIKKVPTKSTGNPEPDVQKDAKRERFSLIIAEPQRNWYDIEIFCELCGGSCNFVLSIAVRCA